MSTGLIDIMKLASLNAMDANQMCDLRFGTVTSTSPLKVRVTNQFTIPESLLVVPEKLTDYTVTVSMDWATTTEPNHSHTYSGTTNSASGGSGEASFSSHSHGYSGTTHGAGEHNHRVVSEAAKKITIHNALKVGDKVALIRKTGGQSYFILDRI